jgi:hypothetical protein
MTRRRKFAATVVLMVASLVGVAAPASATDAEVVELNRLSNLTVTSFTTSGALPSSTDSATGAGCSWRKIHRVASFSTGAEAWRITNRGDWCWGTGGKVRSVSWAKSFSVGSQWYNQWEWVRWENTVTGGGIGLAHVYRRITGHLKVCLIISLGTVCDHAYPWAALTLRGDGTAAMSSGS